MSWNDDILNSLTWDEIILEDVICFSLSSSSPLHTPPHVRVLKVWKQMFLPKSLVWEGWGREGKGSMLQSVNGKVLFF